MRQVGEFSEGVQAALFVQRLNGEHITALIEEEGGSFIVWVHDEGHIKRAKKIYSELKKNDFKELDQEKIIKTSEENSSKGSRALPKANPQAMYQPYITKLLLFVCAIIYISATFSGKKEMKEELGILAQSKLVKNLLIDYPKNDVIRMELIDLYGLKKVNKGDLPKDAAPLIKEYNTFIPWVGVYNIILRPKQERSFLWEGHLFGDIRKGEVWRLFTPAILHLELLHFLFNMLWLLVLGKMVEFNMGRFKFALFVLITAILSNIAQYFMGGPYFMGISGVLSALIGYIWIRKKKAPWEIYGIRKEMVGFFLIYIFGLLGLQCISFLLQYYHIYTLSIGIANTAHITGFLAGMLLAKTNILSRKSA